MTNHLFCFGLGYVATKLADELLESGWRVSGTCSSANKFAKLRPMGITPHLMTEDLPLEAVWDLEGVTHMLISIPPIEDGDIVLKHHLPDLQKLPNLQWVGYLSTTGVYGDHQGAWVTEESECLPSNERSEKRVDAENQWLDADLPVHIFRLSGIYGEGRSSIDALKNGKARRIDKVGQVFCRIHVEDITQILQKSIAAPDSGQVYNCADDMPAAQEEVVAYAAKLLNIEPPKLEPFESAGLSPMASSFYSSSRKVSNQKIKDDLGVVLKYKDYKSGLDALA